MTVGVHDQTMRGVVAMLLAMGSFSLMDVALKVLSAHYPPLQVAALRGLTSLPLVLLYVRWQGQLAAVWRVRWLLHLLRGVLSVLMLSLFAHALQTLSLASAYVLFFIAPVLVTLLSVPVLKERVGAGSVWAVLLGLAGVWVAMRPGPDLWQSAASWAVLGAATCYAVAAVVGRVLTRTDAPASLVFWTTVSLSIGGTVLAWPGWVSIDTAHTPWLVLLAVTGLVGQIFIVEAFRHGRAAVVAPFEYSALAWGVFFDMVWWQVWPESRTWLGATLVVAGGLVLLRSIGRPKG